MAGGGWSEEEIDGETTCSDVGDGGGDGGGGGSGEDDDEEEIQEVPPSKVAKIKEKTAKPKKPEFACQPCKRSFPYQSMLLQHQKTKAHLKQQPQPQPQPSGKSEVPGEIAERQAKLVELGAEIDRVKQELHLLLLERETNLFQLAELYKRHRVEE